MYCIQYIVNYRLILFCSSLFLLGSGHQLGVVSLGCIIYALTEDLYKELVELTYSNYYMYMYMHCMLYLFLSLITMHLHVHVHLLYR